MKKHLIQLVTATLILSTTFAACKEKEKDVYIEPTHVTLTPSEATLFVGERLPIIGTVWPENATVRGMSWYIDYMYVAFFYGKNGNPNSNEGVIQANHVGSTILTVRELGGGLYDTCYITVVEDILGTVSFATDSTWTIGSQTWSDAVQTADCSKKTSFKGGSQNEYNADCRSNPDYKGDLFSWGMIDKYKTKLCPSPWRVPTREDFIELDKALGGTGSDTISSTQNYKYIYTWGGASNGSCTVDGVLKEQGVYANYWSQSSLEENNYYADALRFGQSYITPQNYSAKNVGFSLRCVK